LQALWLVKRAEELARHAEVLDAHSPQLESQFTIVARMPATRDEALTLGPEGQLVGIVSHPDRNTAQAACVILNAGVLHRVGPHRLHVSLARRLAAAGMPGLRLDLGGIGDSTTTSDAASFRESAVADTRVAMQGLTEAVGSQKFVLFGVCAGADNAIATALADSRVAGIVLVDPHTYISRRAVLRDLRVRLERRGPRAFLRWGFGVAERRLRTRLERLARRTEAPPAEGREPPPIATHRAQLNTLVERGVKILAVFSGIHGPRYNHADQLFELFPELRGRIDHVYFPTANHTFTELATQAELLDAVSGWIAKRFG
jgi:hypothetical protein